MKKTIYELVMIDIFDIWDNKGVEYAISELRKLYFEKYHKLTDMEEKRLILYNLMAGEAENNNWEAVRLYSKQLKEDMDNTENYKENSKDLYAKMLTFYRDSNLDTLSYDEINEINEFYYDLFKDYTDPKDIKFLDMLNAKFNLNLFNKNFSIVIEVIQTMLIHKVNSTEYCTLLNQMYNDVKNTDESLYKTILKLEMEYNTIVI